MAEIKNPFAPLYDAHSKVLILGTMPSPKSRENGFYYGHPQNRFWRVLAALLEEPLPESNEQKRQMALRHGIALYDVLQACEIQGAADASIRQPIPSDLQPILQAAEIRALFATGKKAAELYKKYSQPKTQRSIIALPSPSPANCAVSLEQLTQAYAAILDYLR